MRSHDAMKDEEAKAAAWEATRGAGYGALKYGAAFALLGGLGYALSPIYRGLTIQFKVYVRRPVPSVVSLGAHRSSGTFKCRAWSSGA